MIPQRDNSAFCRLQGHLCQFSQNWQFLQLMRKYVFRTGIVFRGCARAQSRGETAFTSFSLILLPKRKNREKSQAKPSFFLYGWNTHHSSRLPTYDGRYPPVPAPRKTIPGLRAEGKQVIVSLQKYLSSLILAGNLFAAIKIAQNDAHFCGNGKWKDIVLGPIRSPRTDNEITEELHSESVRTRYARAP